MKEREKRYKDGRKNQGGGRPGQTLSSNAREACTVQRGKIREETVQAGFEALSVPVLD